MRYVVSFLLMVFLALPASGQSRTHTVQQGETLFRIAQTYGLTVPQLRALNGIEGDVIKIGQELIVTAVEDASDDGAEPEPAAAAAEDIQAAADSSGTAPPAVAADTTAAVPDSSQARPATPPSAVRPAPTFLQGNEDAFGRYPVDASLSLYDVANRTGLGIDSLRVLNPEMDLTFETPDLVRVPREHAVRNYRVKSGDTLFGIARDNQTSVDALRRLNNLTGDRIRIGQMLRVPGIGNPASTSPLPAVAFSGRVTTYPERFAGRLTSSGVPYDPAGFSAAHTDLPLGSIVLLSAGDETVFAHVNDRMPVRTEFILEISDAAFRALGQPDGEVAVRVIDRGVAR